MLLLPTIPLHAAHFAWFVAGGWALDLFLNRQTRPHSDVDLGVFRRDQFALQKYLSDWDLQKVVDGVCRPWKLGDELLLPIHEVRAKSSTFGQFEVLLAEATESDWIYRRNTSVKRPLSKAVLPTASKVSILAPELVLLFKSKSPKTKDQEDFQNILPALSKERRHWLHCAIAASEPGHHWLNPTSENQT